ncbi:MAG: LysR family transcriptional regulator, partial [Clostridia bacterium]|nr:LysR family transcriptional regulator [Clostridia bacterium]
MNTRHARVILTILRAGSFTAAARELGISQPTLSQTVRQIETQLDETLFVRGRSSMTLTPAGECYVQAARRMIQAEDQLAEALSQLRGRVEGRLRIGLMPGRSAELMPQILDDFLSI